MTTTAATGATAARTNMSIEFIVRPKENLYLNGSLRRLPRVNKGMVIFPMIYLPLSIY